MKLLAIAILAGAASARAAGAAPKDHLDEILASRASLLAALGDPVAVGLILWDDPACTARFGAPVTVTGNDRGELATCLANLHLTRARLDTGSAVAAIGRAGAVVAFELRRGKIAALGAAAPDRRDARFPTVLRWWINRDLTPSEHTRALIARTPHKTADAIFKICHDDHGVVASRRIVRGSGITGFDDEALAYFKTIDEMEPVQRGEPGATAPVAACSLFAFRYPELLAGDRVDGPAPPATPTPPATPAPPAAPAPRK
jgi:hypothetical protein